jgi:hypothetical protein
MLGRDSDSPPPTTLTDNESREDALPGVANLVTSNIVGDLHYPLIDIDHPMAIAESSSGNYHLMIKKEITTEQFMRLLDVMAEVGIVQKGFADAARARGYSALRLPGLLKGTRDDYPLTNSRVVSD